jgi:hypothetical protein
MAIMLFGPPNPFPLVSARFSDDPDPHPLPSWLPADWESCSYPAINEVEAARQWLIDVRRPWEDPEGQYRWAKENDLLDTLGRLAQCTGQDAFRLARHLAKEHGWRPLDEPEWTTDAHSGLFGQVQEELNRILQWMQDQGSETSTATSPAEAASSLPLEAKALALLVQHPDWTDTRIAKEVPCSRTSLYRWPRYGRQRELRGSSSKRRTLQRSTS